MNSERRHELQQNELAAYLERLNKALDPYKYFVVCGVAVVFCLLIGWGFFSSTTEGKRSDATLGLINASAARDATGSRDAEAFAKIGDDFPDTAAGARARLYQADLYLGEGIRLLYTNRGDGEDMLDQATGVYREALDASDDILVQSRAHFGIARAAEARGDIEAAIKSYEEALAVDESKAMTKKIEGRIDSLRRPETEEFFAWFQDQDFSSTPLPPSGLPDSSILPDDPGPSMGFEPLDLGGDDRELSDDGFKLPSGPIGEDATGEDATGDAESTEAEGTEAESTEGEATEAEATGDDATEVEAADGGSEEAETAEPEGDEAAAEQE